MSKILIVEDDQKIAISLAARLRSVGHETCVAYDGVGGVMAAAKEKPDLIIMDINMPAGNGITAAERIRSLGSNAGVPIIFITASSDPEHRQSAEAAGASAFIAKPFQSEEVVRTVEVLLQSTPTM
ncbi:MAG: response regulator transcription factor [Planctomycetota bacterium]|jgi:CheY-like chemotaxis protein